MSITMFRTSLNTGNSNSIFAGNLPMMQRAGLKSSQEKAERQQKAAGQIEFWEKQKESLKNMECDTLEDIARKLDSFHTYEDEIAAVKMQYNQEQMRHTMDEARELGEKIAKEAEKSEPKTAEERRKEAAEEALGTDENKGELTEILEDMQEEISEMTEELTEKTAEEILEAIPEETPEDVNALNPKETDLPFESEQLSSQPVKYKRIDLFV